MATIPLAINTTPLNYGTSVGESGPSLQALINQTKLQEQAIQAGPTQLELQKQKLQQEQIATQEAQQNQKDQLIFNQAFKDANGDWDQAVQGAIKGGVSGGFATKAQLARNDMLTKAAALTKDQLGNESEKSNALAESALKVIDAAPEDQQSIYATERNKHLASGAFSPNEIPEQMPPVTDLENLAHHNKFTQDLISKANAIKDEEAAQPTKAAENAVKQQQSLGELLGNAQNDVIWQSILKNAKIQKIPDSVISNFADHYSPDEAARAKQMAVPPEKLAAEPLDKQEAASWLAQHPKKTLADYAAYKATLVPAFNLNMGNNLLNSQPGGALDMAAENYFASGQLPAGARSPGMISSIINRASQLHPNGTADLAGNRVAYAANKDSYDNVTKTLDTLSAFEKSGLKNLKQFTDLASKLPDTGIPWLNTPVRLLNEKLVGAEYMPAIDAARSVALREIARVTNDPKLSGSLTDSARQEVAGFSPQDATLPQIKHVVTVLQNDMANVHTSLAQQKADIGARLGIKQDSTQAGAQPTTPQQSSGHKVGDIIIQNGKKFKATAVDSSGKVTKADPQ